MQRIEELSLIQPVELSNGRKIYMYASANKTMSG